MTREEAIEIIRNEYKCVDSECDIERSCGKCPYMMPTKEPILKAYEMAIKALSQEPCDDAISREAAINIASLHCLTIEETVKAIKNLPSVTQKSAKDYLDMADRKAKKIKDALTVTQKSGKWIDDEFGSKCSCCGIHTHLDKFDRPMKFKYCSMCGAKMESEDKE